MGGIRQKAGHSSWLQLPSGSDPGNKSTEVAAGPALAAAETLIESMLPGIGRVPRKPAPSDSLGPGP